MYVTVSGAGDNSGNSWANAMALSDFSTDFVNNAEAGDRYFIKEGTYTLTGNLDGSSRSGTQQNPIKVIGVVSATTNEPPVASDYATGTARPLISASTYSCAAGAYGNFKNMRIISAHSNGFYTRNAHHENCFFSNTSGSAYPAVKIYSSVNFVNCEFTSSNGPGVNNVFNGAGFNGCYFHDCGTNGTTIADRFLNHCIFDTCTTGALVFSSILVQNCTFYNCTTGVLSNSSNNYGNIYYNNVFDSCTDGFKSNSSGTVSGGVLFDYNNWSNNTHDMSWDNGSTEDNSAKGPNDTANTPNFTNAAGGDFSLQSGSSLIDAGFSISLGV